MKHLCDWSQSWTSPYRLSESAQETIYYISFTSNVCWWTHPTVERGKKRFSTSKAAEVLHLEARAKQGTLQQLCCQNDLQPSRRGFYLLHSSSNLTHDFSTPVFYCYAIQNVITPTRGAISPSPLLQCSNDHGMLCVHWHPGITHGNSHSHSGRPKMRMPP